MTSFSLHICCGIFSSQVPKIPEIAKKNDNKTDNFQDLFFLSSYTLVT
jgi:hypothetical protein